jgi:hypothetical protein
MELLRWLAREHGIRHVLAEGLTWESLTASG